MFVYLNKNKCSCKECDMGMITYENENARLLFEAGRGGIKNILIQKKPTTKRYISEKRALSLYYKYNPDEVIKSRKLR